MRVDSPPILLPTDNEWGVPCLSRDGPQVASVIAPVVRWGSVARRRVGVGTWVLYVDDYRLGKYERLADQLIESNPQGCVEPNFTAFAWHSRAEVLWGIYRKRWVARSLQDAGTPVMVDLCVPPGHSDLALLGVPIGWRAFATRGFAARADEVRIEYELAALHAGREPLMLVYGGGQRVREICRTLQGSVYVEPDRPPPGKPEVNCFDPTGETSSHTKWSGMDDG